MRVEYEKLFSAYDELVDFLCKPNEEQDRIVTDLLTTSQVIKAELFCQIPNARDEKRK